MRLPETITRQFLSCFKFILLIKLQKDTLHAGHLNFCIGFERKPFHLYHFALQFYDVIRILMSLLVNATYSLKNVLNFTLIFTYVNYLTFQNITLDTCLHYDFLQKYNFYKI